MLRDYLAALHVPVPKLDPYFAIGARRLLATKDLTVKLFAMQLLAEGTAMAIFRFLADAKIEPVLTELLPYIEKDEARHVGLGVLYLPQRLAEAPAEGAAADPRRHLRHRRPLRRDADPLREALRRRSAPIPRDLIRGADKMLHELSQKIGPIPGTDLQFFPTNPTQSPSYEDNLDFVLPRPGKERPLARPRDPRA